MKEKSLSSQPFIYNHMTVWDLKPETVPVDNDLLKSVKSSKMRQKSETRKGFRRKEENNGKLQWQADILVINSKKCRSENACETLTKDFEKLIEELGKRNEQAFVVMANCQKRKRN